MESQVAVKPSLTVPIKKNVKTHIKQSEHINKELTTVKFNNSTNINPIFKRYDYIDFEIPSGFNDISKIDQVVIDLECEVSKTIDPSSVTPQTLFLNAATNEFTLANPNNTAGGVLVLPANSIARNDTTRFVFTAETLATGGEYLSGNYLFTNIRLATNNPTPGNTTAYLEVGLISPSGSFTGVTQSGIIPLSAVLTGYNFTVAFTRLVIPSGYKLVTLINIGNTVANPAATSVTIQTENTAPNTTTLQRSIYFGQYNYIQNLPVFTIIDRIQILINGKVCDEIASQNYFCELALQDRETLRNYSSTMCFDPESYSFLYNYPGIIVLENPGLTPAVASQRFKYQIPMWSTFLSSKNYITDFVKDKITVRLFIRPYDNFKVSSPQNAADSMSLIKSSLYLIGTKYSSEDIENIRAEKGKEDLVSMILLRKYGSNGLIRVQQPTGTTYAPLFGQAIYDLSFINGRYICLFNMIYPDNVLGGENYLQYAYPPSPNATVNDYSSNYITANENLNIYPQRAGVSRSKNNLNGYEYLYTPDSAFSLDRVSIIDDLGNPVYQNLQYAPFLRNVMSTTGVNNDFLKTYAIYPFYFSNNIGDDYKNQHAEHGYKSIKNIYNIEIILSNPDSSSLPFRASNGSILSTLQNSLWTVGLMAAELHIRPNGKLVVISN